MKTLIIITVLITVFSFQVQAVPESVAFGPQAKLHALTKVKSASWEVYTTNETGEKQGFQSGSCYLGEPFTSTSKLIDLVKSKIVYDFFIDDPRKLISIDTFLTSESGEVLFGSSVSFYLDMVRDENGVASYTVPERVPNLYFFFEGVRVNISGAVSVRAISGEKEWNLDVTEEGVWIPGYFSRTNAYKTLQITYDDGETHEYDWFGQKVEGKSASVAVEYASFEGVYTAQIQNGALEYTRLNNNEGWSFIIELNNHVDQDIKFNLREYQKPWSQPTHIWFFTTDEDGNWLEPVVEEYSTGTDWSESHTEVYTIPSGTWHIILEWRGDTKLKLQYPNYYYGSKG